MIKTVASYGGEAHEISRYDRFLIEAEAGGFPSSATHAPPPLRMSLLRYACPSSASASGIGIAIFVCVYI